MDEPLPRWFKGLLAVVGLVLLGFVVRAFLVDDFRRPQSASWRLAPSAELTGTSREIPILVNENECASGRSAEGRIVADVDYQAKTVRIDVGVRPLGGDRTCPGNPDTPFVVELSEPLGERALVGDEAGKP